MKMKPRTLIIYKHKKPDYLDFLENIQNLDFVGNGSDLHCTFIWEIWSPIREPGRFALYLATGDSG